MPKHWCNLIEVIFLFFPHASASSFYFFFYYAFLFVLFIALQKKKKLIKKYCVVYSGTCLP